MKDSTGAVLPGVTVEASSPALIEKVKTAATNEAGQYRIVDLRPGTYTVTFTLTGFNTVVREGILLEANFTAPINAEMRVGAVSENVTVTGASPVVDVQTSTRREVVSQQLLEAIPTGRSFVLMANTVPSVSTGTFDVGGSAAMWVGGSLLVHGSLSGDSRTLIDGMVVDAMFSTGQCSCVYDNEAQTQEMAVQVTGGSAENQLSGVLVNRVPRTGGNQFNVEGIIHVANGSTQSVNLDDALRARGLTTADQLYHDYDVNYSGGGPILRDKLWFFVSGRNWAYNNYVANSFNKDGSRAIDDNNLKAFPARLTWQADQKNRFSTMFDWANKVRGHRNLSPTINVDAAVQQGQPAEHILQGKWTSTVTNHLLFETGYSQTFNAPLYSYQPQVAIGTCHVAYNLCAHGHELRQHSAQRHRARHAVRRHTRTVGVRQRRVVHAGVVARLHGVAVVRVRRAQPEGRLAAAVGLCERHPLRRQCRCQSAVPERQAVRDRCAQHAVRQSGRTSIPTSVCSFRTRGRPSA